MQCIQLFFTVILFIKHVEDVFKGRSFTCFVEVTFRHHSINVVGTVGGPVLGDGLSSGLKLILEVIFLKMLWHTE